MGNKRYIIHGIYADLIEQYIEYKRNLGFKMEDAETRFAVFDRLTIERGETKIGISKELFELYGKKTTWESYSNLRYRLILLRSFSAFLRLLGYDSYIPYIPPYKSSFKPYIFTKGQINAIFREADKLYCAQKRLDSIRCAIPSLIRLLYSSGPRVNEALNMKHSDFNLENDTLLVRASKNGEERILSISPSMREVILDYWAYKESVGLQCAPEDYLFTAPDGSAIKRDAVSNNFRLLLYRAGIPHMGNGQGPRVHDLRHTFCVNALVSMSESGMDLYTSMPILMTYVGHKSLAATNRYIRITEEMFPKLISKVNELYSYIFPELDFEPAEIDYSDEDE